MQSKKRVRLLKYDPLFFIRIHPVYRFSDLDIVSTMFFRKNGSEGDVWTGLSANLFKALVLFLIDIEGESEVKYEDKIDEGASFFSLSDVLKLSVPEDGSDLGDWLLKEVLIRRNSDENQKAWADYLKGYAQRPDLNMISEETLMLIYEFVIQKEKQRHMIMLNFNAEFKKLGYKIRGIK